MDDHPVIADRVHAQGIVQVFKSMLAETRGKFEDNAKEKERLLQQIGGSQELVKERTASTDALLEEINKQIKACPDQFSDIAPISTRPVLNTAKGEFRIELDAGDFDDIDEAAAEFKQALANTADAKMQEDYYKLNFELESLNKSRKDIIDRDMRFNEEITERTMINHQRMVEVEKAGDH